MSLDTRNSSALFKRAEQLKRWEESETNRIELGPKSPSNRRIKFSSGCIFLAACVSGDKDEVLRLIDDGADIDTANVDGLTALHQVNNIYLFIYHFYINLFYFISDDGCRVCVCINESTVIIYNISVIAVI